MHRRQIPRVLVPVCFLIVLTAASQAVANETVALCHVPPGNPDNAHTIMISENAVPAHLGNHPCDHLGECVDYFPNGVASGDADQSSAFLWARGATEGSITFEYGQDPGFAGTPEGTVTLPVDDPSVPVKTGIDGLAPGTQYYYRACRGDACLNQCAHTQSLGIEAHGTFRTPHAGGRHGLRFGVSSCWRGDLKPFNSIKNASQRDLDFFVALGDTVYADSNQNGPRVTERHPDGELKWGTVLNGFRMKNECQYSEKSCKPDDPTIYENIFADLRASTVQYATIDDHEVVDNFSGGARPTSQVDSVQCSLQIGDNRPWGLCFCPDPDPEGDCNERFINDTALFDDGMQAFQEYNPIDDEFYGNTGDSRTAGERKLYRYRTFGKDAAIFMLDTRSFRSGPIDFVPGTLPIDEYVSPFPAAYTRGRTMLGSAQLTDLLNDLRRAQRDGITWKFVLVPEPIQHLGWLLAGADRFEGYGRERGQILDFIQSFCIENVVFISGDIHATVANNLVYKKSFLALQRFSETWDISTGAVSYPDPYAKALVELLNKALDACQGDPICEGLLPPLPGDDFTLLPAEQQTQIAEELLNVVLTIMRYPQVGLEEDGEYPTFLQKENEEIPATLLQGRYSALATWGWTEFEIDPGTRKLLVTSYGIDPAELETGPLSIVSQFEVEPATRKGNGASCENDTECSSCRCSLTTSECIAGLSNGALCVTDSQCASDRCSAMGDPILPECQPKAANGRSCLVDNDCLAGDCGPFEGDLLDRRCHPIPDGGSAREEMLVKPNGMAAPRYRQDGGRHRHRRWIM